MCAKAISDLVEDVAVCRYSKFGCVIVDDDNYQNNVDSCKSKKTLLWSGCELLLLG